VADSAQVQHLTLDADLREPRPPARLEALQRPFSELARYAGWLAKDHVSVAVRAGVRALGLALEAGGDASLPAQSLERDIARLPSGDLRKMLRKALAEILAVLAPVPGVAVVPGGEGS